MSQKQFEALSANIADRYNCKVFDIRDAHAFIDAYNKHYGYTFRSDRTVRSKRGLVDLESYITTMKNELLVTQLRSEIPLSFIPEAVKNKFTEVIDALKAEFLKSIAKPTDDERTDGLIEFDKLADAFLGVDRTREGFEMEKAALYTWMAQAKYKLLHGFSEKMVPFVIHLYSERKGLGKSFVARRLLEVNKSSGIGMFSSKTSSQELLDGRNITLIDNNNIILLDDFEGVDEKQQESWKSIITDPSQERRILGSSITKKIQLDLAIMTVGNREVHSMIYNEQRERRMIQLHIDGQTNPGERNLPAEVFENIDYDMIWKAVDETQYNMVWDNYSKEVIESQDEQTTHTWFHSFVEYLVEEKVAFDTPLSMNRFFKDYYNVYCAEYSINGVKQKALAGHLERHTDILGYGSATRYKDKAWKIVFDFSKGEEPIDNTPKVVDIKAKLERMRNAK